MSACLAGIVGFVIVSQEKHNYEARVQMLVGPINTNFDTLKASGQLAQSYAELASTSRLLQAAIAQLHLPLRPTELGTHVQASANTVTRVLTIRVRNHNPRLAVRIANTLGSKLATLGTAGTASPAAGQLRFVDPAETATRVQPKTGIIVAAAVLAGLLVALIIVLVIEYLSNRVKNEEELAELAQVACLGVVDRLGLGAGQALLVEASPDSREAASYRLLAAKIESAGNGTRPVRSLLVVGAEEAQGSGELAANLAAALTRTGQRVTLVDANRDEGEITNLLGLERQPGIGEFFQAKLQRPFLSQKNGLSVLARGKAASSDRVEPDRAARLLSVLLGRTDLVVLNAAPIARSPSALVWARAADATLLVAHRGATRRESVSESVESLRFVGANVIGAVLSI